MNTLIIPAAGLATRLRPISNVASKCMVPVNGKPTISYILDSIGWKYNHIVIVYGKNEDVITYVKTKYPDLNVCFEQQDVASGPLHAIYWAFNGTYSFKIPKTGSVDIWLGDTIITNSSKYDKITDTLFASKVNDYERWCMVSTDGKTLYDKSTVPVPTNLALVGVYKFSDIELVKKLTTTIVKSPITVRGEYQLSQLIDAYKEVHPMTVSTVEPSDWFDTGDLPSLYDSSARLLQKYATRPDSDVHIDISRGTFTKRGERVENEINWYKTIPDRVKPFVPSVYSYTENSYTMELLNGTTVANMLLYERLNNDTVRYIIRKCLESYKLAFFEKQFKKNRSNDMLFDIHVNRVREQKMYTFEDKLKFFEYINRVDNKSYDYEASCIHGDFHLGNIMFFPENGRVKFIDPRGNWGGVKTTSGNVFYDMVKFAQSIVGEYIWIYEGIPVNHNVKSVATSELTLFLTENGFDPVRVYSHVPVLLGSILDFHGDSKYRQQRIMNKTMELVS